MKKYYKTDFMPQGLLIGYCSLTVIAWIFNYFFTTNFSSKDNFDLLSIAKWGRQWVSDLVSLEEIGLLCERLYLSVTIYTAMTKIEQRNYFLWTKAEKIHILKKYIKPIYHHNIKNNQRVFEDWTSIDIVDELLDKRLYESSIWREYSQNNKDLENILSSNQKEGTLFVLGCNRSILYNEDSLKQDGDGHVVICLGLNNKKQCIIYEPIHPRPNPHLIDIKTVQEAMSDIGWFQLLMIKDNVLHQ